MITPLELERDAAITEHPRSPHASTESLRRIAGIIQLSGPVPVSDFLDGEDEAGAEQPQPVTPSQRARD